MKDLKHVEIQAAEQAQQITDSIRVAWTSLGTVKAMLPELLASDDVKVRENAQIIDALVELVGNQQAQQAAPVARDWPKIDAAMRDYVEGYGMIGDNNEVCYSPTKAEQELIIDCMRGLLADDEFIGMLTTQPPAVAVPDGYALVPIEPTEEMMAAVLAAPVAENDGSGFRAGLRRVYRAMLAAAQKVGA